MPAEQGKLLPFYLVIDVSISMSGDKLAAANTVMPTVVDTLAESPILADKVRFGLIDFSDEAQVRMPLCDPLDTDLTLPQLAVRGRTSYAAAFRLLRTEIEANVKQLKADGFAVHRPAVFFLSDGAPSDRPAEWQDAFHDLTWYDTSTKQGFSMYPNVVPCGVDDADPLVLQKLIHPASGSKQMRMYLMDQNENAATAITHMAEILISSVLASGESMAQGGSGLLLPTGANVPQGITAHTADADDFV